MKKNKILARICAFTLAASLIAVDTLPVSATAVSENTAGFLADECLPDTEAAEPGVPTESANIPALETTAVSENSAEPETTAVSENSAEPEMVAASENSTEQEAATEAGTEVTDESSPEKPEGLIYVNDTPYSGYYMDSAGIFYIVTLGVAEPASRAISKNTVYYRRDDADVMTSMKLSQQTVFAAGKPYTGYYINNTGIFCTVSKGVPRPANETINKNTAYYRSNSAGALTPMKLSKRTVFVKGKAYTGYYTDTSGKMYAVTKGTLKLKTGTIKKGGKYYNSSSKKIQALSKQTLYIKGKTYTGNYMDSANKMYSVKKGISALKTGIIKKGDKYFSYKSQKTRSLAKETLYVRGKAYTGLYLSRSNTLYRTKKGILTPKTGIMSKGTKYYSYKSKKTQKLAKETLYIKGKVYTGHYLSRSNKMYSVKKGTLTLKNGVLDKGSKYYSYNSKKSKKAQTLAKKTIYVNGKALQGMSEASMATLQRAQEIVARVTNDRMSKEEKLKACFDFVKTYTECNPRLPHYTGMDWPVIYANDMFINGTGNCCSYGSAFAYMAKTIGYEEVYCCNSGGHGWAEIDGLVYDPEWSIHNHGHSYYALSYDAHTDQNYKGAIAARLPWMHIKI